MLERMAAVKPFAVFLITYLKSIYYPIVPVWVGLEMGLGFLSLLEKTYGNDEVS